MKRFASHYLYLPSHGLLRQYVVEIDDEGRVTMLFPLKEESESVIWVPGVIVLISQDTLEASKGDYTMLREEISFSSKVTHSLYAEEYTGGNYQAFRLYPFDYTQMKLLAYTKIQRLDNYTQ